MSKKHTTATADNSNATLGTNESSSSSISKAPETEGEALGQLADVLTEQINLSTPLTDNVCPPMDVTGRIRDAVVNVEHFYSSGKLPVAGGRLWRALWKANRDGASMSTEDLNDRLYEPATKLLTWVKTPVAGPQPIELPTEFTPTEPDIAILRALSQRQTRCKTDALAVTGAGQRTVAMRLLELERAGLVNRAAGKRSGWAITKAGRTLLASFAHDKRT